MKKIAIIGSGAAGISAAASARKTDVDAEITIVSEETVYPYFRPALTKLIGQVEIPPGFFLKNDQWFEKEKISFITDFNVKKINSGDHLIESFNGRSLKWDSLIVATGGSPSVYPEHLKNNSKVTTIRSYSDILNLNKKLKKLTHVTVCGGGLLGLETAWFLKKSGMEVEVLEFANSLLPRQLDETGGEFLLRKIENCGIKFHSGTTLNEISDEGCLLSTGRRIKTDHLIFSMGIRGRWPEFSSDSINTVRYIEVDNRMMTKYPDVYACGDCASIDGFSTGLWMDAVKQGNCAGINSAGGNCFYSPESVVAMLLAFDTHVMSYGNLKGDFFEKRTEKILSRIYFEEEKITGGYCIGDSAFSSVVLKIIKNGIKSEITAPDWIRVTK
ncbi:MAG: FAD-dependent oxidoreductase [Deltaproteobacteria bacterium]|nr:FAD-dependent oxidoreductase [Deltaproteobacteria bacterium]